MENQPGKVGEEMMPGRGGGMGYLPPSPEEHQSAGGYPALSPGDFVEQLLYNIATLEDQLMCSHADREKLYVELETRSKALEVMNEKYVKLEEDYESLVSYAATRGGIFKDGRSAADQHFAQKCVKLEAKIAKNRALSADKEKIKLLEEAVKRLEEDNKRLEGSLQKQGTELEIQRSLNVRFRGMFKKVAEVASENCREMDGLMAGLREGGAITFEVGSPARTPMEGIGGGRGGDNSYLDDMLSNISMELPSTPASWNGWDSGGSSVISGGGQVNNEWDRRDEEEDDLPPPAAFLDACDALTPEDWEIVNQMALEMEREKEASAAKK